MSAGAPDDTDPEVFRRQVAAWAQMSPGERGQVANQLSLDVRSLAVAGIRWRRPDATSAQINHELARRWYGRVVADAAYPVEP
jgi:hypothetical protein